MTPPPTVKETTTPARCAQVVPGDLQSNVDMGDVRRLEPVSRVFGLDRGLCIDRYYIENFLARHAADVHGRVFEVADNQYTRRFGGPRVTRSDVLHVDPGYKKATIVADLTKAGEIPADTFDCIILTQTLQHIYDLRAATHNLHRSLKKGGTLLATAPGISQISRYDMDRWGDFWRFTTLSLRRLVGDVFAAENVDVQAHGNVLAATAFLQGQSAGELTTQELDHTDPDYQLLLTVRAKKAA